jgi:two-component system sensor histidine kinase PhcS
MLWLLLPQIMIAFMIFDTDGADSIYFVGLHLAMYAVGIILPISFFEGVGFGVLTLGLYVAACALHPDAAESTSRVVTNSLFILFSAGASAVCTWFNEKARIRLFQLQHEVSEKNASLREINTTLAEVKGQLIQREKMAAIGTLSAGLLHELNNPVNYSLMAIDMGLTCPGVEGDAMLKESMTDAREGMQRIQNIVSDLKTFAYQKPGQDAQRPCVLINLLSNAAHALQAAKREHPQIAVTVVSRGERLAISVRDNGSGIAPENVGRVFEPFFTTRDVGAGLGLGLSVSYGIVQRHGGILAVESELGAWTDFTFDLPRPP